MGVSKWNISLTMYDLSIYKILTKKLYLNHDLPYTSLLLCPKCYNNYLYVYIMYSLDINNYDTLYLTCQNCKKNICTVDV